MSGKEDYRIFVGGLSWNATERQLENAFDRFGKIAEVQFISDGIVILKRSSHIHIWCLDMSNMIIGWKLISWQIFVFLKGVLVGYKIKPSNYIRGQMILGRDRPIEEVKKGISVWFSFNIFQFGFCVGGNEELLLISVFIQFIVYLVSAQLSFTWLNTISSDISAFFVCYLCLMKYSEVTAASLLKLVFGWERYED